MADEIDRKAFESMIEITDPFDPLFAPNPGKSVGRLNKSNLLPAITFSSLMFI